MFLLDMISIMKVVRIVMCSIESNERKHKTTSHHYDQPSFNDRTGGHLSTKHQCRWYNEH